MFRNMIPFDERQRRKYPLGYERFRNWLLHRVMLRSMLRSDLVIFISDYAKQVVERHTQGQQICSVVIPHGIARQFRTPTMCVSPRFAPWLESGYLLYVSYLDFYKAQIEVVQAYAIFRQQRKTTLKLLLVGPENPVYGRKVREEINRLALDSEVIVTGPLPYAELPQIYHGATLNIFASESENCPNILLEAMAAGRPVLSSNKLPMPEFGGDGVLYFDPTAPAELAAKLCATLDDKGIMEDLGRRARKRSELYDWEVTAGRTWGALTNVRMNKPSRVASRHRN